MYRDEAHEGHFRTVCPEDARKAEAFHCGIANDAAQLSQGDTLGWHNKYNTRTGAIAKGLCHPFVGYLCSSNAYIISR